MTWTAPEAVRVDEPLTGDERVMRDGFLDYNRATLLQKCAGLTGEQLATQAVPPSALSLLGLVRHLTDVERNWFRLRFGGQEVALPYGGDAAFTGVRPERAAEELAALVAEQEAARQAVAGLPLDHAWTSPRWGPMSLRWVLQHMSEEYARHNGHADLLRERLDGRTGD
jgi:uncharacterized damage-inducible protein DinB